MCGQPIVYKLLVSPDDLPALGLDTAAEWSCQITYDLPIVGRAYQASLSVVPFRATDDPRRAIATRVQLSAAAVRAMAAEAPKQIPTPRAQKVLRRFFPTNVFMWSSAPAELATCAQVKVALCQLAVSPDKDMNIQKAQKAIKVRMQPTSLELFYT